VLPIEGIEGQHALPVGVLDDAGAGGPGTTRLDVLVHLGGRRARKRRAANDDEPAARGCRGGLPDLALEPAAAGALVADRDQQ
jgi:hypothetical protein